MPNLAKLMIGVVVVLALGSVACAQTNILYVSGGPTIYLVNVSGGTGTPTVVYTDPAGTANFESVAIGPDNAFSDVDASGNALYAYFLYLCDTAGNTVTRIAFAPGVPGNPVNPERVYSATLVNGSVVVPVCGRSSAAGDFYITNESGKGLFVFPGMASVPSGQSASPNNLEAVPLSPDFPRTMTGRALTQKYVGDLFIVDNVDHEVLRSPYAVPFGSLSTFTSSNLNGPVGIATAVTTTLDPAGSGIFLPTSDVFVANSNSVKNLTAQPPVSVFNAQTGMPAATCPGLKFPSGNNKQVADYLASTPTANSTNSAIDNTIYLVSNASNSNSGVLWSWNTAQNTCTLNPVASFSTTVSGVAVVPAPVTLNLQVSASNADPTPTNFNFNSSLFQLTATGCTASVTAYPLSQAAINSMINLAQSAGGDTNAHFFGPYPLPLIPPPLRDPVTGEILPATPTPYLGDAGFEIAYVAHWSPGVIGSCTSVFNDMGFLTGFFGFIDPHNYVNPRVVQCDNSDPTTEPQLFPKNVTTTCGAPTPVGVYPLSGPIGGDSGLRTNSVFALVNQGLSVQEPAEFCGLQPPLSNVPYTGGAASSSLAGTFSASTNTVNVKFKLAQPGFNCKKNFITDAVALISVARVCNTTPSGDPFCGPNGSPVFNAINVQPTASSLDLPPEFNSGNQQYSFTLNLPSIFQQAGAGIYSLTITFLSDNTTNQTFLFQLNP